MRSILNLDTFYAPLVRGSRFLLPVSNEEYKDIGFFWKMISGGSVSSCSRCLNWNLVYFYEPLVFSDICSVSLWKIRFSWETAS